jgi:DNA-directed RNA polymerase subunit RPC12/RpoP
MPDDKPLPDFVSTESKLEGIQIYKPAPLADEEHREVVDFKCPQCGATTAYSIPEGGLTCTHCGYFEAPQEDIVGKGAEAFEFTVATMVRAAQGWGGARTELTCQNCGARTTLPQDSLTHTCPFCASVKVVQREAPQDVLRPRFLIPFKLKPDKIRGVALEWLGSSWMTPSQLRNRKKAPKFTPVYLPFWTFDSQTAADWEAEVGHTVRERYFDFQDGKWKTRTKIEWRWESGRAKRIFDDLLQPGTSRLRQKFLQKIRTFNLSELVPYEPHFLAGLNAQAYDILLENAWESARLEMREQTRLTCRGQASTPKIRNFSMHLDYSDESWRYILLPVYVAAYRYEGQVYQTVVNGQNGDIAGRRPVDWQKVWLVIAALLAPGFFLGLIGFFTLILGGIGVAISGLAFLIFLIGLVISFFIFRSAREMESKE